MRATPFTSDHPNLAYREPGDPYRTPPPARRVYNREFEPFRRFLLGGILPPHELDARYATQVENPPANSLELRYGDQMWEGDELADHVVEMFYREGPAKSRRLLEQALDEGISSMTDPPGELVRLFAQLDRIPDWIDEGTIENGNIIACRGGLFSHTLFFLIDLILTHYTGMARPLAATGKINAEYRLLETATFFSKVSLPGSMVRYSEGFKRAVLVRIMHALVRRRQLDPGHRSQEAYDHAGMIISNHDMGGMCWAYSLQIMLAYRQFGGEFTDDELHSAFRYWCYICYVMGVNEETIPKSFEENCRYMNYHWASAEAPVVGTGFLREQILRQFSVAGQGSKKLSILGRYVLSPMMRRMFGDAACDNLGIPDSRLKHVIRPMLYVAIRSQLAAKKLMFHLRLTRRLGDKFWDHYNAKVTAKLVQVDEAVARAEHGRSLGSYSHHDTADGDGKASAKELRSGIAMIYREVTGHFA